MSSGLDLNMVFRRRQLEKAWDPAAMGSSTA